MVGDKISKETLAGIKKEMEKVSLGNRSMFFEDYFTEIQARINDYETGYLNKRNAPGEKVLKENKEEQAKAVNTCLKDLYNYYETCGTPEDFKNHKALADLLKTK